jgi:hypothetical protein
VAWNRPKLTVVQILRWADQYHATTGRWPKTANGSAPANLNESWRNLDNALRYGLRGLPGGSSLARLLDEKRGVPNKQLLPRLTVGQILAWSHSLRDRTGRWPRVTSGPVAEKPEEDWRHIDMALREGLRGLPGGDTLARFLARHVGKRNRMNLPRLTVAQILTWADQHHERTGAWPRSASGRIGDGAQMTWAAVNAALRHGLRGLPGGQSLARFLSARRGYRNPRNPPRLTVRKIMAWAKAHHRREGRWPSVLTGAVRFVPGETWNGINQALTTGTRGLPGGSSVAKLLAVFRAPPACAVGPGESVTFRPSCRHPSSP